MAYTTINKSSSFMNPRLYTGNAGTKNVTGVGFKPDWVWTKNRQDTYNHSLFDVVRGATKRIASNATLAEATVSASLTAFGSDGFSLGNDTTANASNLYASWNWLAGGSQGSSNTDGSINTTYTSVNTTAGFSISQYTGTGSAGATFGHGLGSKPAMIIFKCLSVAGPSWVVYHQSKGATYTLYLDQTSAGGASAEMLNNTEPTSSLITLGNGTSSNSSAPTIAYCFSEKVGYSKFGSYIGNGNVDGTFIYTGFKPAFVMVKNTSATENWIIFDNTRPGRNLTDALLKPNLNNVESTNGVKFDLLSNGFKARVNDAEGNSSGASYIYMAFGQSLVGTNNIPNNAF